MTLPMYIQLPLRPRNGLVLIHAMTLWRDQDEMSRTTVEERNQPHTGGSKKMKKPLGTASRSWQCHVSELEQYRLVFR